MIEPAEILIEKHDREQKVKDLQASLNQAERDGFKDMARDFKEKLDFAIRELRYYQAMLPSKLSDQAD